MTTAIIGLGNMGKGIAARLAGKTDLVLGVANPDSAAEFAASVGARVTDYRSAVAAADMVILAVPYGVALELAGSLPLAGKVVVDISNPLKADFSGLSVGHTSSAAEEVARVATGARVVKAFNTIFASLLSLPASETASVQVFLAGDDAAAVDAVADLVGKAGFAVEKTGGIEAARLLEPLGMLNIRFGYSLGRGTGIAPAILSVG